MLVNTMSNPEEKNTVDEFFVKSLLDYYLVIFANTN